MLATVHTPYYDWDGRKYMEVIFADSKTPTRIKIPYRYGRVMCHVEGLKTVQEFQKGDEIEIEIEKKTWDGIEYLVWKSIRGE